MAKRYRITTFRQPRAPWRDTAEEAMSDAVKLELASWDASRREWFLAVPVEMQTARRMQVAA